MRSRSTRPCAVIDAPWLLLADGSSLDSRQPSRKSGRHSTGSPSTAGRPGQHGAGGSTRAHPGAPSSTQTRGWSGAIPSTPMPKPDITLTDQHGQRFALKPRTHGKVTLLYFGYTHCPDVCPLTMSMLAQAVKALPAATVRDIAVVFVTTDPARDTPAQLRQWLANFDRSFVGLTGSHTAIIQAQRQVGAPPSVTEPLAKGSYGVDHGAFIYAYSPDHRAQITAAHASLCWSGAAWRIPPGDHEQKTDRWGPMAVDAEGMAAHSGARLPFRRSAGAMPRCTRRLPRKRTSAKAPSGTATTADPSPA